MFEEVYSMSANVFDSVIKNYLTYAFGVFWMRIIIYLSQILAADYRVQNIVVTFQRTIWKHFKNSLLIAPYDPIYLETNKPFFSEM